jgi:hypothetical protein
MAMRKLLALVVVALVVVLIMVEFGPSVLFGGH